MSLQSFKHFEILKLLGRGGMGEVYLAHDATLERQVALKFLPRELLRDPSAQGRLLDEARSISRISHPNIATIHSIEEDGGIYALCMEYVDGLTLKQVLSTTRLSMERIVRIAADIAAGMQAAHDQGVIHRDLKPANVMISRRDEVKIMDFGLALRPSRVVNTLGPNTYGTVQYMSPEQARGEALDVSSDIFSFGSTLYEMITGTPPFEGPNDLATLRSIISDEPPPLRERRRDVPPALEQVVRGCMAKDPAARWASMRDVGEELKYLQPSVGTGPDDLISELSTGLRGEKPKHHEPLNAGAVGRRGGSSGRRPRIGPSGPSAPEIDLDLPEGVYVHEVIERGHGRSRAMPPVGAPVLDPSRATEPAEARTGELEVLTTGQQWQQIADDRGADDRARRAQGKAVREEVVRRARASRAVRPVRAQTVVTASPRPRDRGQSRSLFLGIEEERGTRDVMRPFRERGGSQWAIVVPAIVAVLLTAAGAWYLLQRAGASLPGTTATPAPVAVDAAETTPTPPQKTPPPAPRRAAANPPKASFETPLPTPPALLRRPDPNPPAPEGPPGEGLHGEALEAVPRSDEPSSATRSVQGDQ